MYIWEQKSMYVKVEHYVCDISVLITSSQSLTWTGKHQFTVIVAKAQITTYVYICLCVNCVCERWGSVSNERSKYAKQSIHWLSWILFCKTFFAIWLWRFSRVYCLHLPALHCIDCILGSFNKFYIFATT